MMKERLTNFAIAAAAVALFGLGAAATASAETYQGGVLGGPDGGHGTVHWQGTHPGSANAHWH
jgi:hypothetical protein